MNHFSGGASSWGWWHSTLISYTMCFALSSAGNKNLGQGTAVGEYSTKYCSLCLSTEAVIKGNTTLVAVSSSSNGLGICGSKVGLFSSSPEVSADRKRSRQLFRCWSSSETMIIPFFFCSSRNNELTSKARLFQVFYFGPQVLL